MVALPSRRSGLRGLLVGIAALTTFLGMRTYVPTPSAQIAAAPALAPTPVRAPRPDVPLPIDETRYGEKVRWLADRQLSRPPEWRVLLLDKTFRNVSNTTAKVAACLVSVLGLAGYVAKIKAEHAKDHFFSVVAVEQDYRDAVRKAQALQGRGLAVRVVPGTSRSTLQPQPRKEAQPSMASQR
ncbi:unnamed protein product [Effrenium voratum]|uniref:Uncharacterized protein n=1 Tax=Effrenium voratum TaxID=2562239 RepID=A0AA36JIK1_9DINO|nr:unnamed protein product [Effrenium voratum]CAJ1406892.1 unnamed protein product [Effrenium voratum]CAJ1458084.1 unnamed protein product [Effrenium voratum]|mmetsp:Transcript_36172/g.86650  ORF Transcript_36172/g.86650 Transcript_36172/m.86650 type:complete len:183 (+) Transcript_36172:63-611(+)|eukprot:CAMPEP_0181436118 /NCGR_PEP_ID=MMETSP1110-20121109/20684_1 /TAXON_ID=174948 /ORGANISM="Symbiodinium sp., Strain CCMP421" /LENGTH=182 /DNA_ID=CAMNT_0023559675 /DNA_START=58 /DNA_END=606 /DNA_ORIENTATION=+